MITNEQELNQSYPIYAQVGSHLSEENMIRVGAAYPSADSNYYTIKLYMFPFPFFLNKRSKSQDEYTIFARRLVQNEETRFRTPVGYATLKANLPSHMQFEFPLLDKKIYMSLFPK